MRIPVYIKKSKTDRYVQAYCPDLVGCSAVGSTQEKALDLLQQRIKEYFETCDAPLPPFTRRMELEI